MFIQKTNIRDFDKRQTIDVSLTNIVNISQGTKRKYIQYKTINRTIVLERTEKVNLIIFRSFKKLTFSGAGLSLKGVTNFIR